MSTLCPFVLPSISFASISVCWNSHLCRSMCVYIWMKARWYRGNACVHVCVCVCVCVRASLGFPWDQGAIKPVCSPVGEERNKAKCQRQMASVIATCAAGPTTKTQRESVCACVDCMRLCRWACPSETQWAHVHMQSLCWNMCTYSMFLKTQTSTLVWHKQWVVCYECVTRLAWHYWVTGRKMCEILGANLFIETKFCAGPNVVLLNENTIHNLPYWQLTSPLKF